MEKNSEKSSKNSTQTSSINDCKKCGKPIPILSGLSVICLECIVKPHK